MERVLYLAGMYSAVRAAVNRRAARKLPEPAGSRVLHLQSLEVKGLGSVILAVHARPRPENEPRTRNFAMLSVRQVTPRLPRFLYSYLCETTHFGFGHLELGFYEEGGVWVIHAVRNTARANALRIGCTSIAKRLSADWESLIRALASLLRQNERPLRIAPAADCVRLSVRPNLIPHSRRERVLRSLQTRYERLEKVRL